MSPIAFVLTMRVAGNAGRGSLEVSLPIIAFDFPNSLRLFLLSIVDIDNGGLSFF